MTPRKAKPGILRISRLNALIFVLALHVGVVLLLLASRVPEPPALPPQNAIEIVYLPPTIAPKVKAGTPQLQHVVLDPGISLAPRTLDATFESPPASQPDGEGGPGVNWIAEAHRAVKAFEIRRDEHVIHDGLGLSPWEGWLPKGTHHPGEKYRTPSGDWIVWISTNCYQIASWQDSGPPHDQTPPNTICTSQEPARHASAQDPPSAAQGTHDRAVK